jgi:hypothetical protein
VKRILASSLKPTVILVALILCSVQLTTAKLDQVSSSGPEVARESGETFVVTSTADSGPGTLRQALLDAQIGDTIDFDTSIFPPDQPKVIYLLSALEIVQGSLTIDASRAGVILDGSKLPNGWISAIQVTSNSNTVSGFQMRNFSGAALHISGGQNNLIKDNVFGGSDYGIGLWSATTSNNTITGNYVGVLADGVTPLGNRVAGIVVQEGAHDNQIGPDNYIAFNDQFGISIRDTNTIGNTITQNSIHDNHIKGIDLYAGGNMELAAPLIFDFDLGTGTAAGIACPDCTVEIFSDGSDEGMVYEGRATANRYGAFTINKGSAFLGPHLTTTGTDADGNTSEFSVPTWGTRGNLVLQQGNNLPKARFRHKRSGELADNHIGAFTHGMGTGGDVSGWINWANTEVLDLGVKLFRFTINSVDYDKVDWSTSEFYIPPAMDEFVNILVDNGLTLTYILSFWDKAHHPEGWGDISSRFQTEEDIQRYLEFVRFIVRHFKGRVQYFELWNEPDNPDSGQYIDVASYVNLVRRSVPVIRQEYPEAKILVGSIALQYSRDWLFSLLRSDVMPLVDVVTWHPMYGVSPEHNGQYYYEYPSLVDQIRNEASAHGFGGEYIAAEMTWRSLDCFWCNPNDPLDSNIAAAKYYARGIVMHLGMDIAAGTGGHSPLRRESFTTIQNLCTIMAGAEPASLSLEIQSEATNVMSYTFSLSNGDYLLALWTDGVAVDNDPGIPATLIFPGITEHMIIGIDVLHGFQQQLITSEEDGNLVIRELLVKDYPLILRVTPTKYMYLPTVFHGYGQ